MKKQEKEVDVKKIIKDLAKSYGDSNEDQGKLVNLMKGLAFSDDDAANKFMKALDKWTTEYADKNVKENTIEIKKPVTITQEDEIITLEKGDRIKIILEAYDTPDYEE